MCIKRSTQIIIPPCTTAASARRPAANHHPRQTTKMNDAHAQVENGIVGSRVVKSERANPSYPNGQGGWNAQHTIEGEQVTVLLHNS